MVYFGDAYLRKLIFAASFIRNSSVCFGVLLRQHWVYIITHSQEKINLIFFLPGFVHSCVKLDALEPCEDVDSPVDEESEEEKEEIITVVIEEPKEKWDCESILSKYFGIHFFVPRISK